MDWHADLIDAILAEHPEASPDAVLQAHASMVAGSMIADAIEQAFSKGGPAERNAAMIADSVGGMTVALHEIK